MKCQWTMPLPKNENIEELKKRYESAWGYSAPIHITIYKQPKEQLFIYVYINADTVSHLWFIDWLQRIHVMHFDIRMY